ncbi:MAG: HAMP domain-containing histidine kinase [Caldilineaceae bacterium]|nr:HAMP domain-containing histidine kinase [Caldilineaceae bacterium]
MNPRPRWESEENKEIEIPLAVRRTQPQWHGAQWHGDDSGQHHRWARRAGRRPRMFARMAGGLLLIVLLGAGVMTLASHLFFNGSDFNGGSGQTPAPFFIFLRICGVLVLLPTLLMAIGSRMFRAYAVPLADIMDAAEAVAAGNLDVRVKERGSREFQQLAHSFNRMTEELARTDQQRRNLTADVAHELRTPLHIIQGNLEGVLDGVYAPTPEHIDATLQETRTLARLVDDLRTLSLAESGELPLHPETVDIHDLLADVTTSFSPQAESAGIYLCVDTDTSLPLTIYGDPGRMDQVLSNLVSNALRHTPAGGKITLSAAAVQNAAGKEVQLMVSDTGEGIAPEDLPFIFDRFWRADRARTHSEGTGSGLGLAIAGQLVRAHGGTITVTSTPGSGTTFTVTLPMSTPDDRTNTDATSYLAH